MKQRLIAGCAVLLSMVFLCLCTGKETAKQENASAQDLLVKSEVETAVSMLQAIDAKHQQGAMSLEKAKALGADLLRGLRYGTDGYFWADTQEGVNVVLYGRKDVEGKNRLEYQDPNGVHYVKEFIATGKAGGFVEYLFTKKDETTPIPKRSYVLLFEPFGWTVGSGYYR